MSELIEALGRGPHAQAPAVIALRQFVKNGKDFDFQKLVKRKDDIVRLFPMHAFESLPPWETFDDEAKRFVRALVSIGMGTELARRMTPGSPDDDEAAATILLSCYGEDSATRVQVAEEGMSRSSLPTIYSDGRPTPWGRFLLSLSDRQLATAAAQACDPTPALDLLLKHAPERVEALAPSFLYIRDGTEQYLSHRACEALLTFDAQRYEQVVAAAVAREPTLVRRAVASRFLAEHFPERYETSTRELGINALDAPVRRDFAEFRTLTFLWLLNRFDSAIAEKLAAHFRRTTDPEEVALLRIAVKQLGPAAAPLLAAAANGRGNALGADALKLLIDLKLPEYDDSIRTEIQAGLSRDGELLRDYVMLAGKWRPAEFGSDLFKLLDHYSAPVRELVIKILAKLGDGAVGPAAELIRADAKTARLSAIRLLERLSTPEAARVLEDRVEAEADDKVRAKIIRSLDKVRQREGRSRSEADKESQSEAGAGETSAETSARNPIEESAR
jgi:hypothetical protein